MIACKVLTGILSVETLYTYKFNTLILMSTCTVEVSRPTVFMYCTVTVGIQADLWTETIRTPQHLHYMLFPRFLAFAERAWHKASWEDLTDVAQRDKEQQKDWERFAAIVGKEELERLESEGVEYRLDPPGAR